MIGESYLLGIDAGGTHTICLLADQEERILGRGEAGAANVSAVGLSAAVAAIGQAVAAAWQAAGLTARPATLACLGVAGGDRPQEKEALEAALAPLGIAARLWVVPDALIALAAASREVIGVVIIAGTGSIAWGRNRQGDTRRAGGWGYILGDEGSAFDIGLSALRAAVRAHDGRGQPTALTDLLVAHWALSQPEDLRSVVYGGSYPRLQIAALAPVVERAARQGDAVARRLYAQAADELALAAKTVIVGLGMQAEAVPVALSGGVFQAGELIIEPLIRSLRAVAPHAQIARLEQEPAMGAVHLAAQERSA
jgi:N-acetylglucosamine kinase-like BadF-type ATPase